MKLSLATLLNKNKSKQKKDTNWINWAVKIFKRKDQKRIVLQPDECAYSGTHVVGEAVPFGGGYRFVSKACSGCELGRVVFGTRSKLRYTPCVLLESPLFTKTKVKQGDTINLDTGLIVP